MSCMVLVRQLNAEGTAILLVEQSVNVALYLVDRATSWRRGESSTRACLRAPGPPRPRRRLTLGGHADEFGGGQRMSLLTGFDLSLARLLLGFFTGLIYGLLAVGLVLVFRASRFINFAQRAIGVFGAPSSAFWSPSSACRTGSRSWLPCSRGQASRH